MLAVSSVDIAVVRCLASGARGPPLLDQKGRYLVFARSLVMAASVLVFSLAASSTHATLIQQGTKLVGTGAVDLAQQGVSVALSADGNTAVVGAYTDNANTGAAWVYTRSGGVWSQQGAKLVGTGAVGTAGHGRSVALSADGNTAIVGGIQDNSSLGAAWVYTRSGGVWSQQGAKLIGTGAADPAYQGASVALSGDGNTAVVGGYSDNGLAGAAWVFVNSPAVPSLTMWGLLALGMSLAGVGLAMGSRRRRA
jgi:hypothetical protein